ncbi:hypothetical protein GE21DRAFT_1290033 [Neurospora crassa]|nr:hypothetical protein GE21DRAFT_1290033 [Neurospora crassa]
MGKALDVSDIYNAFLSRGHGLSDGKGYAPLWVTDSVLLFIPLIWVVPNREPSVMKFGLDMVVLV